MQEINNNMYYALVWNTALSPKAKNNAKDLIIHGEKITRHTRLPNNPRMLYGTNNNDVAKIVKVDNWIEIKYDIMTQKQSVKFWSENDEYILSRDMRIIVWIGESELSLPSKKYKIVSPPLFEHMVMTCFEDDINYVECLDKVYKLENEIINLVDTKLTKDSPYNYDEIITNINSIIYRKRIE